MNNTVKKDTGLIISNIIIILLLLVNTICGVASFDTTNSYEIVNQYGDTVRMWGSGIYSHDSYFMAPIFIGSDFTILLFIVSHRHNAPDSDDFPDDGRHFRADSRTDNQGAELCHACLIRRIFQSQIKARCMLY